MMENIITKQIRENKFIDHLEAARCLLKNKKDVEKKAETQLTYHIYTRKTNGVDILHEYMWHDHTNMDNRISENVFDIRWSGKLNSKSYGKLQRVKLEKKNKKR